MFDWLRRLFGRSTGPEFAELALAPSTLEPEPSEPPAAAGIVHPDDEHDDVSLPSTAIAIIPERQAQVLTAEASEAPAVLHAEPIRKTSLGVRSRPGLFAPAYSLSRAYQRPRFFSPDRLLSSEAKAEPLRLADAAPAASPQTSLASLPAENDLLLRINLVLFAESDPVRQSDVNERFLLAPQIRALTALLRDQVLENWQQGHPPLSPPAYYEMASKLASEPSTALLLCYNVARVFSDGGTAVPWTKVNRTKGIYSTGIELVSIVQKSLTAAEPSILPQLFDHSISEDRSDWHRYFGAAWLSQSASAFATEPWPFTTNRAWASAFLKSALRLREQQPPSLAGTFSWANAVYFHECEQWGQCSLRALECQQAAFNGADFGKRLAPHRSVSGEKWFVARPASNEIADGWSSVSSGAGVFGR